MTELEITVDKVAAFERGAGEGDAELKLRDGTRCRFSRQLPHFDFWAELLETSLEYGWHLYVACEPSTGRLKVVLPAQVVNVESVEPDAGGERLTIRFQQLHAVHVLEKAERNYDAMALLLAQAAASDEPVIVTADPRGMAIVDVRPA